jgi:hypothetical protein
MKPRSRAPVLPPNPHRNLNVNNLKAGAPAHADCNTSGNVCGDDDVVADDDVTAGDDVEVGGDLEQARAGNGSVKAAVFAACNGNASSIHHSFVTVTGYTSKPTITALATGRCRIDFNFDVSDRYVMVQPVRIIELGIANINYMIPEPEVIEVVYAIGRTEQLESFMYWSIKPGS